MRNSYRISKSIRSRSSFVSEHILLLFGLVTWHGKTILFSRFIMLTLFSRRSRRLVRYDCGGFTNESQLSVETDVTKNPEKQEERETERRESSESRYIYIYIYIGVGGTKVCIESRNANASNIDTASPFERSLNLSQHSSHPFSYGSSANSNTAVCAHMRPPAPISPFWNGKTHARAEDEWVEWKDPQSIGCAGFSMTINDQIRETSVRVNVRVLLATSGAADGSMCACVCIRVYM